MFANETTFEAVHWRRASSSARNVNQRIVRIVLLLYGDLFVIPGQVRQWYQDFKTRPTAAMRAARAWGLRTATYLPNILVLLWLYNLFRGEYSVFDAAVNSCDWSTWEQWPAGATPHHIVYVADPQLVDPHTYPGRPWPLSTLTVQMTDLYLRRAYSRIQRTLDPPTVIFLGDLFDGGREWSTRTTESPEEQYRQYGHQFWQKEFDRFSSIFLHERKEPTTTPTNAQGERRVIASLPGNHDLGFGAGIQIGVRDRFQAFFGDGNRIDLIGNHTFVSLDSVSLSAKEQTDAAKEIWQPADDFLKGLQARREDMLLEAFARQKTAPKPALHSHSVQDLYYPGIEKKIEEYHKLMEEKQAQFMKDHPELFEKRDLPVLNDTLHTSEPRDIMPRAANLPLPDLPTVLLTHVPLYRKPGEPCGPLRERHPPAPPPAGQKTPVDPDLPNAISVSRGYQYQNVLTESLTKHIVSHVSSSTSGDLKYAFSGDDHDYCEVVHNYGSQHVKEITVKSISWAMGVRHPGVVLASLWNPLDANGQRMSPRGTETMQTHLCLLPDQLGRFIHYAVLLGISLAVLLVRAVMAAYIKPRPSHAEDFQEAENSMFWYPQLHTRSDAISKPTAFNGTRLRSLSSTEREKRLDSDDVYLSEDRSRSKYISSSSSSTARTSPVRSRGNPPNPPGLPSLYSNGDAEAYDAYHDDDDGYGNRYGRSANGFRSKLRMVFDEWAWCLWYVARVAVVYYLLLLRY